MDKRKLIEYDYRLYNEKYNELMKGIKNNNIVDGLDLKNMKQWSQEGIFRRKLKFQKKDEYFYITTASISRGNGYSHDIKFGENYIIPYWGDQSQRANELMKFDIGDESPKNGKLELIGDFEPFEDNLLNITYQTKFSKENIENAKKFIDGQEKYIDENRKINISSFFRLNFELASQGIQVRALYDMDNSIIDGSAGTGKSTIAIQKLKYIFENENINQEGLLIVVKNINLKEHFDTLLKDKNINLPDINIKTINEQFNLNSINSYDSLEEKSKTIKKNINDRINNKDINFLEEHYNNLLDFIGISFIENILKELINNLGTDINLLKISKLEDEQKYLNKEKNSYIRELKKDIQNLSWKLQNKNITNEEYNDEISIIEEELENYKNNSMQFDKDIQKVQKKLDELNGKKYRKTLETLSKNKTISIEVIKDLSNYLQNTIHYKNINILKWILGYKNFLSTKQSIKAKLIKLKIVEQKDIDTNQKIKNKIINLEKELDIKYKDLNQKNLNDYIEIMKKVYFSKQYFKKENLVNVDDDLIYKILNIDGKEFDTIIVDEAQDFSRYELELIRLYTNRIILTGDILQNIDSSNGISDWNELLNIDNYKNDKDELNKFILKHNFRQTYQLANASYNYRQLLLDKPLEDIGYDYYESEKIFNGKEYPKPKLILLDSKLKIIEFIESKLKHIEELYTEKFPIIVVYPDEDEYNMYKEIFSDFEISNNKNNMKSDIILLNITQIKGNQFPIVIANMNLFSEKELYLIMTRAQFELEFFIIDYQNFNPLIYDLIYNKEQIKFLDLGDIDISKIDKDNSKKIETILNLSSQSLKNQENFIEMNVPSTLDKNELLEIPTTIRQVKKHKAETFQYTEELEIDDITNEEKYQKKFIEKIKEDIKEINNEKQLEVIKEIVIVRKKSISNKDKELRNKIKSYLFNEYKGYCQICGFTFRKIADGKNSFEIFNWNDKRVVKQKKSFVTTADSLCLCRNCSSNIKWGAFEPIFMDKINQIENFINKNLDEMKKIICVTLEDNIVDEFRDNYEWHDIYALEITINGKPKNIYMTNGHFIQFIAYLQLELKG